MTVGDDRTATVAIPCHVAIVMDGNGRWAKKRFLPRFFGHKAGMDTVVKVVDLFADRGVEVLTLYAFSSENWKRPSSEVSGLMSLILVGVSKYLDRLIQKGVRIRVIGQKDNLPEKLAQAWDLAEAKSAHNTRLHLCIAFNYGGRADIVQACQAAMRAGIRPEDLTEQALGRLMQFGGLPEPDLLIRTGGELRISNFLLWQAAYAELYFTDTLWPDFDADAVETALASYARRERRYGQVLDGVVGTKASNVLST